MNSRTGRTVVGSEVTTRLTEPEAVELKRRANQFGIHRAELVRRYVRAGLAVRSAYGTVVDATTGAHLAPAGEPQIRFWIMSYHSQRTPGIFVLKADGRPASLGLAAPADRRVTILDPPDGFDTADPGSPANLRILDTMRTESAVDRATWMP